MMSGVPSPRPYDHDVGPCIFCHKEDISKPCVPWCPRFDPCLGQAICDSCFKVDWVFIDQRGVCKCAPCRGELHPNAPVQ